MVHTIPQGEEEELLKPLANRWVDVNALYAHEAHELPHAERVKLVESLSHPLENTRPGELGQPKPMSVLEELAAVVYLFFFIGSLYWVACAVIMLFLSVDIRSFTFWAIFLPVFGTLCQYPLRRWPGFIYARFNAILLRYFSFRMAWMTPLRDNETYLLIAPPHGCMPFVNVLALHGMRNLWGFDFLGLTTNSALKLPILRHYMSWLGVIPATPRIVKKELDNGWSIGINSGGVAEIFETNDDNEVVLMSQRKGFVKMALRTGATIVPCYMFGNTQLLSVWYDPYGILRTISRRLRMGVVLMWGRFGLPIMYRRPCLAAFGRPIRVQKVEGREPTMEEVDKVHAEFLESLLEVFDHFKGYYGWQHKKLILK